MDNKPFYRFFAIDYFETGCGRSIWLQICLYDLSGERDYEYENFARFVHDDYYLKSFEELTEHEFLDRYTRFIPYMIADMLKKKTIGTWQQHLHFNLS